MQDIDVIEDPAAAVVALDPIRSRLLAELKAPASAAALAVRLGWRGRRSTTTCACSRRTASSRCRAHGGGAG
jgi:hypothetical protein